MKTVAFKSEIEVNPQLCHTVEKMAETAFVVAKDVYDHTKVHIPITVKGPNVVMDTNKENHVYTSFTLSSFINPNEIPDVNLWKRTVIHIVNELRKMVGFGVVTVKFFILDDFFYISDEDSFKKALDDADRSDEEDVNQMLNSDWL